MSRRDRGRAFRLGPASTALPADAARGARPVTPVTVQPCEASHARCAPAPPVGPTAIRDHPRRVEGYPPAASRFAIEDPDACPRRFMCRSRRCEARARPRGQDPARDRDLDDRDRDDRLHVARGLGLDRRALLLGGDARDRGLRRPASDDGHRQLFTVATSWPGSASSRASCRRSPGDATREPRRRSSMRSSASRTRWPGCRRSSTATRSSATIEAAGKPRDEPRVVDPAGASAKVDIRTPPPRAFAAGPRSPRRGPARWACPDRSRDPNPVSHPRAGCCPARRR